MYKLALALFVALFFSEKTAAQLVTDPWLPALVNPFIGTGGHGHTFPGATAPFGLVQLSPDTRVDLMDWDACSGYHYSDSVIYGFSHTHLSGTGIPDYCDVLFQPLVGSFFLNNGADGKPGYSSVFKKSTEFAQPGFYEVFLEKPQTKVELTATERVGVHRYTFPKTAKEATILIDLRHRDETLAAQLNVESAVQISGYRISKSWAAEQHCYFYSRYSKPFKIRRLWNLDGPSPVAEKNGTTGKKLVAELVFDVSDGQPLVVAVGISGTDPTGAEVNVDREFGFPKTGNDWSDKFDSIKKWTQLEWQRKLLKIRVEGGTPGEQTVFYTALYHSMLAPNVWSDADGRYRGRDQKIHRITGGSPIYTVFSLWDTYRALHPLMTILEPDRVRDWMYTFWRQFEEGGRLPIWELAANETDCMIGNHAIPVISDAFSKKLVPDSLAKRLHFAMKEAAMGDRLGLKQYREMGFVPSDEESESVSKTIEYSFDDFAIWQMAIGLGRDEDAAYFGKRSENWKNLLDPETGFFRARNNGSWVEPFDPTEVNFNFTEANAWQYGFVQHDFQEQKRFYRKRGGTDFTASRLDSLFNSKPQTTGRQQADITGLVGQYAQGNEPSHHMAYLYNSVAKPWKTQQMTRKILRELFTDQPDGLPGNDDCGQMSAWVVWSMMGLYPVNPAEPYYWLTKPVFSKIQLRLPQNREFLIQNSPETNEFQMAWPSSDQFWIQHDSLVKGGNLSFSNRMIPLETGPGSMSNNHKITPVPFVRAGQRVFTEPQNLALGCLEPTAKIRFTLDGSEPTETSPLYEKPVLLENSATLKAAAWVDYPTEERAADGRRVYVGQRSQTMTALFTHQADRKNWKTTYENPASSQYTGRGDRGLIDGLRGGMDFRSGGWQGFEGKNLELVIDMGEKKDVKKLTAGFLQDNNSWIFLPSKVSFQISADGKKWVVAGDAAVKNSPEKTGTVLEDFVVEMAATKPVRFIKIIAHSLGKCPDWHKGRGHACWLFADEILME